MTYRGMISWLIAFAALFGCAEADKGPDVPVYDDPTPTYQPPSEDRVESKADVLYYAPRIVHVEWSPVGSCNSRRVSTMRVLVTVEDNDTDTEALHIEGSVSGCSLQGRDYGPLIQSPRSEILCHHVSVHDGLITVVDPDGNGDSAFFRFGPCESGSYTP